MPTGVPGMGIGAWAKRAYAHFIFFGHGQSGHWKKGGQAGKSGHGHDHFPSLAYTYTGCARDLVTAEKCSTGHKYEPVPEIMVPNDTLFYSLKGW